MPVSRIFLESILYEESQVKIPVEKGDLGLSLDDPLKDYKEQLLNGKKWDELSQQIKVLAIYNKNNHPSIAGKADELRDKLADWVESKRKENPDFAK